MPTLLWHHCRLDSSSHRTTCGIIADLWLTATFPLLWDLAASFDEAVRDQNLSLFLRHHRQLSFALTGACNIIVVCIMLLLGNQCETITRSFLRHHADFDCGFMPTLLPHHCRLDSSSQRTTCGIIADLWLTATFPLLWDLAASFDEAVRDQNLSLFLRHHCRLVAASSPTFICAHRRLLHHCRLSTSLSFIAALMPSSHLRVSFDVPFSK
jgi:hypothetical protein